VLACRRAELLARTGLLGCLLASPAAADDHASSGAAAAPSNYVAGFLGTTVAYRPPGGAWGGGQHDLVSLVGYGRQLSPTVAVELDLGPTFVHGRYSSFSLTPGVVWALHPNLYLAARFAVPVDPEANFVLLPGVGLSYPIGRVMPTLELNVSSAVGRGDPDLGVSLTAGILVFF
jgi:hypothetical protein